MSIENFFNSFEANKSHFNNLFNLEISLKSKLNSPVKYSVEGRYDFKGLSHELNGYLVIDALSNVLGRFSEQYMGSGYNLICGVLIADKVPKLKIVKAPSSSRFGETIFDTLYILLEKSDDNSSVEGSYKGACGLSKSSGSGKDRAILSLKKSMRVQV